jgi:hypothetical protein
MRLEEQMSRPSIVSRRELLGLTANTIATSLAALYLGIFDGRREADSAKPISFEDLPDGEPLIGKRVVFTPTLQEAQYIGKTVMVEIVSRERDLFFRVNGKAYDVDCMINGQNVTCQVKDIRRFGNELHVTCSLGVAHVTAEGVANAAYLIDISPGASYGSSSVYVEGSFTPKLLPPSTRLPCSSYVTIRRVEEDDVAY